MCDKYLQLYHKETILKILEEPDETKHFSIDINFIELFENDPNLGSNILKEPEKSLEDWDNALKSIQNNIILEKEESETIYVFKNHIHCRIYGLPVCPELHRTTFPSNDDANKFLQVSGTVVRMTSMKMLEYQRRYICAKCKYKVTVYAEYEKNNTITAPKKCENPEGCKGTNLVSMGELDAEFCKDYQEIKMQETVSKLDVGSIPNSMWVTLEDDLVDSCKPGDNITVCGVVKRRWSHFSPGKKINIELVIKANHIQVNNNNTSTSSVTPELKEMFQAFWKTYSDTPLAARDIILKSICPQIFGLYIVKLAMAVVLAGGSHINNNSGTGVRIRSEPHLLLVGDPGTGKSQLLKFASKIIPRSVLTTGIGSTAAGLTVTAVMENGEWQLEGGALVLSDGGICCIDEFNSMKEHDRTSIHEAMEQQTISVAKASIVCKLSTRCSVLAATNPKGNIDPSQPLSMNIALASPLLSRFDLILLLRDKVNENWDSLVADYVLSSQNNCSKLTDNIFWTVETLQAYFAVIKKLHPVLTEDSNKILSSYYQAQRRKNYRNKSRTTVRLLDSLVRLSQGHARLMFHQEVEVVDAVIAVILVETAMEADFSVFDLHFDVQQDFPDNPTRSYRELVEIVLNKLQLPDLLKNELDLIDQKLTTDRSNSRNDRKESFTHQAESRYFHLENQRKNEVENRETDSKDKGETIDVIKKIQRTDSNKENIIEEHTANTVNTSKSSRNDHTPDKEILNVVNLKINENTENEIVDCNNKNKSNPESSSSNKTNNQKIKRTKGKNTKNPKKIKLKDTENEAVNDLEALQAFPSILDNFFFGDCDIDENTLDLNLNCTNEVQKNHAETDPKPRIENKLESTEEILSQRTKCRKFLNKFRFIPKDQTNSELNNLEVNDKPEPPRNIFENDEIENTEDFALFKTKNQTESANEPTTSDKIDKDIVTDKNPEILPENNDHPTATKFKFKKKHSEIKTNLSENFINLKPSTMFESQEDLDNLDLDI